MTEINSNVVVEILNLDTREVLVSDFEAEVDHELPQAEWGESSGIGSTNSFLQYLKDKSGKLSLTLQFFAKDSTDNPYERFERLRLWACKNDILSRPPFLRVSVGRFLILDKCVIVNLGNVKYGKLRNDGTPRQITLTVDFKEYVEFVIEEETLRETLAYKVAEGDTWEVVSKKFYGSPSYSLALRRCNILQYGLFDLTAGLVIKVPVKSSLIAFYDNEFTRLKEIKKLVS